MLKVKNSSRIEKYSTKGKDPLPSAPTLPEAATTNTGFFLELPLHRQSEKQINRLINFLKRWLDNDAFNALLLAFPYLLYVRHVFLAIHKQVQHPCQHLHFVIPKCTIIYLTNILQVTTQIISKALILNVPMNILVHISLKKMGHCINRKFFHRSL